MSALHAKHGASIEAATVTEPDRAEELHDRVAAVVATIPPHRRPAVALLLTPEDGIRVVTRGELAARLRAAGLKTQARDVFRMARSADSLLVWGEAEDADGSAEAGLHVLRVQRGRSRG